MHALTLARQRLSARIQSRDVPQTVRLAHQLVENRRPGPLPVLASSLAQEVLTRGYDPYTLDHIYSNSPRGEFGPVGHFADRLVLDLPLHQALRERLDATVGEICAAAIPAVRRGAAEYRVLFAPLGLAHEAVALASRLRKQSPETLRRLRCWGVDADLGGSLLPEAARRTRAAGMEVRTIREDLRRHREVQAVVQQHGPFDLICCTGLSRTFANADIAVLLRFYGGLLAPGGTLLVDRWEGVDRSRLAESLDARMPRCSSGEMRQMLGAAGLTLCREHRTGEGGCVLVSAEKPAAN